MVPIRVWGRPRGFHARKVFWALGELDLPFELVEAGFGIAPTAEFTARNPSALAPVIDDGGVVVWESNVIVRYLCAAYASPALPPPASLQARFRAEQWMDWNATTLWPAIRPLHHAANRGAPLPAGEQEARLAEAARWLDVLEVELGKSAYLAGEAFSMADIPAGLTVDRWLGMGIEGPERPHLRRWWSALVARPAFPREAAT